MADVERSLLAMKAKVQDRVASELPLSSLGEVVVELLARADVAMDVRDPQAVLKKLEDRLDNRPILNAKPAGVFMPESQQAQPTHQRNALGAS